MAITPFELVVASVGVGAVDVVLCSPRWFGAEEVEAGRVKVNGVIRRSLTRLVNATKLIVIGGVLLAIALAKSGLDALNNTWTPWTPDKDTATLVKFVTWAVFIVPGVVIVAVTVAGILAGFLYLMGGAIQLATRQPKSVDRPGVILGVIAGSLAAAAVWIS